jgi:deoxyxylulose-5-phosphate synthase
VPQAFLPHGERDTQLAQLGLDREGITAAVLDAVGTRRRLSRPTRRRASWLAAAR